MKSSNLYGYRSRIGTSIGFSWHVVVFLVAWLGTVSGSGGHEIKNLEGQVSEFSVKEQKDGNVHAPQGTLDHYEPQNRRDPFLPLVLPSYGEPRSSSIEESRAQKLTWKLLGILSGVQGSFASIQNSEGKRFLVTQGSVISSEGLVVTRISQTELEFHYLTEGKGTRNQERSRRLIVSF